MTYFFYSRQRYNAENWSPDVKRSVELTVTPCSQVLECLNSIVVIGDNFGDTVNQEAIMQQLRAKLGIKVVVQMENADGNVIFEDTVTPNTVTGMM